MADIGKTPQPDYPAGAYAPEILNRLLIDLSWNSGHFARYYISPREFKRWKETWEAENK